MVRPAPRQPRRNGELVRRQVSTRIGLVKDFHSKAEAREEAERVLAPVNEGSHKPAVVQPVVQFSEQEFFPFVRQQVRPSTANGYEARWRQVKPWLADLRLRDTTTPDIQRILESIHKQNTLNHDSIRALRYLLKMIFDHAIRIGLLNTNPVSSSKVPKRSEDEETEDTYAYSLEEVQKMLNVLPEPARTAIATCAFTGVRRGELAGLLWENFDPKKGSLKITQSVWEGHVTRPKTKKSRASVPIIRPPIRMLEAHRVRTAQLAVESAQKEATRARKSLEVAGDTLAPEKRASLNQLIVLAEKLAACPPVPTSGPIFSSRRGTALNMNNLLNRQILPALTKAKLEWHGFHSYRRGLGTNLKRLGVDLKTIQEILRHAHIATTADIYVKEVSEQAAEAMLRLEKHVEAELKMSSGPAYSAVKSAARKLDGCAGLRVNTDSEGLIW
ncbi:MAG TPA: tyrosine-type recombinase/integrase [Terriglobales bacterium]|nr:tyrosine-type recombinase/integrase [Terriglobales bacterium]